MDTSEKNTGSSRTRLSKEEISQQLAHLQGWEIVEGHHLQKSFSFTDFAGALAWVNTVGAIAEEEAHHPDVVLRWGSVQLSIWSHDIDALSERDFTLASRIQESYAQS